MNIQEQIEVEKFNRALLCPKLDKSLECLINKYASVMTTYHFDDNEELLKLIVKACEEHNSFLVQSEYGGYFVNVWRDRSYLANS